MLSLSLPRYSYPFSRRTQLHAHSVTLPPGIHALVGVNGAGKSTAFNILAGLTKASYEMTADGLALGSGSDRSVQRHVGYLPQNIGLPRRMRVREMVEFAAWLKGMPKAEIRDAVGDALSLTDSMGYATEKCGALSGGMRRRVALAAAIVHRPTVLLLDEPTAGLDPFQRETFHDTVRGRLDSRYVLVSTHLMEDVAAVADQVLVLARGQLKLHTSVAELAPGVRTPAALTSALRHELGL